MKHNYSIITNLIVVFVFLTTSFFAKAQSDYSVTSIPHQVYTANSNIQFTSDDAYSGIIPLTFDFTFFGNTYNQVLVSTNGAIGFDTSLANLFSPYQFNLTIPNTSFPVKHAVFGCYSDMNSSWQGATPGTITYAVVGNVPYRKFVVLFNNQPAFGCGSDAVTSFQMILYETLNTVDVQIVQRQPCLTWNAGNAVLGIINDTGAIAFTPPGRNTGPWTASQEGWRFTLPNNATVYNYTACENENAGFATFNASVIQNDLSNSNLNFYASYADAQDGQNPFITSFTNTTANYQKIYASDGTIISEVILRTINCESDYDLDSVSTIDEDLNNDGNFANDDTDADGIPNFIDNDDDGDMILTSFEYVFPNAPNGKSSNSLDTDGDGVPNYLDNDDDGDGVLTINEDYNGNNNPVDDDTNTNGIPDYLEQSVALGSTKNVLNNLVSIYPNPTPDTFFVANKTDETISNLAIYTVNGSLIKEIKNVSDNTAISVGDLQSGVYFVRMTVGKTIVNTKLIKK